MIVCHCKVVTDRSIREVVRGGARSFREVSLACNAGRRCGGCRPLVRELIESESAKEASSAVLPVVAAS